MKFLCLIGTENALEHLQPDEAAALFDEYRAFTDAIRKSGHLLGANRLMPPETAATVRVRDGRISVSDGPFAETKEVIGGYYLIEARDLDEAVQIAARIPGAKRGCVEVRPIADASGPDVPAASADDTHR